MMKKHRLIAYRLPEEVRKDRVRRKKLEYKRRYGKMPPKMRVVYGKADIMSIQLEIKKIFILNWNIYIITQ